jgi:hypothetical protein
MGLVNNYSSFPERGFRISDIEFQDYDNNEWMNTGKMEFYYNSSNPGVIDSVYYFEYFNGSYVLSTSIVLSYDANFEYCHEADLYLHFQGSSFISGHQEFSYNDDDHLYRVFMFQREDPAEELVVKSKLYINYDGMNLSDVVMWEYDSESQEGNFKKINFEFDNVGRIVTETEYNSADSSNWDLDYRSLRTYHAQDTTTGESFIDIFSHQYPISMILDGDGDPLFGKITETIEQRWENSNWVNEGREVNTFDGNLNETISVRMYWNGTQWENENQKLNEYNEDNCMIHVFEQYWNENSWQDEMQVFLNWEEYTANDEITIEKPERLNFSLYPNPCKSNVAFKVSQSDRQTFKIEVFNIKGQLVYSETTREEINMSFPSKLSNGIYFMKISDKDRSNTKKLLILK